MSTPNKAWSSASQRPGGDLVYADRTVPSAPDTYAAQAIAVDERQPGRDVLPAGFERLCAPPASGDCVNPVCQFDQLPDTSRHLATLYDVSTALAGRVRSHPGLRSRRSQIRILPGSPLPRRFAALPDGHGWGLLFGEDAFYLPAKTLTPSGQSGSLARFKPRSCFKLPPAWSVST